MAFGSTKGDLDPLEEFHRLTKRVEKLGLDSKQAYCEDTPLMRTPTTKEVICYHCRRVGHYAMECVLQTQS